MKSKNIHRRRESLVAQGFDLSSVEGKVITVRCSQCEAAVINNVACHETGCPNVKKRRTDDADDSL